MQKPEDKAIWGNRIQWLRFVLDKSNMCWIQSVVRDARTELFDPHEFVQKKHDLI